MKKIGFVVPWYGEGIPGGAESECRSLIKHMLAAGLEIEVLSTCIKEFKSSWGQNFYKEGESLENGVRVRRFSVKASNQARAGRINEKYIRREKVSQSEEKAFFDKMIVCPGLIDYLKQHEKEYHCFVFIPYMFQTTYAGIAAVPHKSVIIPCLHDEGYAYSKTVKRAFESAAAVIYHAEPEYKLANNLYEFESGVRQEILGEFLAEPGKSGREKSDPEGFRKKFGINEPYVIYAGRKDKGKNADLLLKYFIEYKRQNPARNIKLVLIGDKEKFPTERGDILDLGFVSRQDKYNAIAGALFLCQPSIMESFSIVIMESWLEGRPVLVHEKCAVTADFARKSGGGLYFNNFYTFKYSLDFYIQNPEITNKLGQQGKKFVEANFSDSVVADKYIRFFNSLGE